MSRTFYTTRGLLLGALVLVLWGGGHSLVQAQTLSTMRREVVSLYRQGLRWLRRRAYDRAIVKFSSALGLVERMLRQTSDDASRRRLEKGKANFLFLLGRCYDRKRRWEQAYDHYRRSLRHSPRDRVEQVVRRRLQVLWPRVRATLVLRTRPSSARVWVTDRYGERRVRSSPLTVQVPPGRVTIVVKAQGFRRITQTLQLQARQRWEKTWILQRLPPRRVEVTFRSTPGGADVLVRSADGKTWRGQTPWVATLPPGALEVSLWLRGRKSLRRSIRLKAGEPRSLSFVFAKPTAVTRPSPPPRAGVAQAVGWSGVAVATVATGVGVALLVLAHNEAAAYNRKLGDVQFSTDELVGHYDRGQTFNTIAIVSLVTATASSAVAIGMLAWGGGKAKPAASGKASSVSGGLGRSRIRLWPR